MHPVFTNVRRRGCDDDDCNMKGSHNNDNRPSSSHALSYVTGNSEVSAVLSEQRLH